MDSIREQILNARKNKNLTQQELAELSKVNLRTIQRIENNENIPRGNTLKLICDALNLELPNFETEKIENKRTNLLETAIQYFFLLIVNLVLMGIVAFMTMDSEANLNSRFAGFLLSFFIPMFIVSLTPKMNRVERLLKFGSGFLFHIGMSIIVVGFPLAFVSGLLACLAIALLTLFYGDLLIKK